MYKRKKKKLSQKCISLLLFFYCFSLVDQSGPRKRSKEHFGWTDYHNLDQVLLFKSDINYTLIFIYLRFTIGWNPLHKRILIKLGL